MQFTLFIVPLNVRQFMLTGYKIKFISFINREKAEIVCLWRLTLSFSNFVKVNGNIYIITLASVLRHCPLQASLILRHNQLRPLIGTNCKALKLETKCSPAPVSNKKHQLQFTSQLHRHVVMRLTHRAAEKPFKCSTASPS